MFKKLWRFLPDSDETLAVYIVTGGTFLASIIIIFSMVYDTGSQYTNKNIETVEVTGKSFDTSCNCRYLVIIDDVESLGISRQNYKKIETDHDHTLLIGGYHDNTLLIGGFRWKRYIWEVIE